MNVFLKRPAKKKRSRRNLESKTNKQKNSQDINQL